MVVTKSGAEGVRGLYLCGKMLSVEVQLEAYRTVIGAPRIGHIDRAIMYLI